MLLLLCVLEALLSSVLGLPSLNHLHFENSLDCGEGMVLKPCLYGCPETCNSVADWGCRSTCRPTCVCPEGTVLESFHSSKCVPRSQCPSVGGSLGEGGLLSGDKKGDPVPGLQSRGGLGSLFGGGGGGFLSGGGGGGPLTSLVSGVGGGGPVAGILSGGGEGLLSGGGGGNPLGDLLSGGGGGGGEGRQVGDLLSGGGGGGLLREAGKLAGDILRVNGGGGLGGGVGGNPVGNLLSGGGGESLLGSLRILRSVARRRTSRQSGMRFPAGGGGFLTGLVGGGGRIPTGINEGGGQSLGGAVGGGGGLLNLNLGVNLG